jgi:Na+-transporting NADH:ubiquinone oxidoreductase subunit NqrB
MMKVDYLNAIKVILILLPILAFVTDGFWMPTKISRMLVTLAIGGLLYLVLYLNVDSIFDSMLLFGFWSSVFISGLMPELKRVFQERRSKQADGRG